MRKSSIILLRMDSHYIYPRCYTLSYHLRLLPWIYLTIQLMYRSVGYSVVQSLLPPQTPCIRGWIHHLCDTRSIEIHDGAVVSVQRKAWDPYTTRHPILSEACDILLKSKSRCITQHRRIRTIEEGVRYVLAMERWGYAKLIGEGLVSESLCVHVRSAYTELGGDKPDRGRACCRQTKLPKCSTRSFRYHPYTACCSQEVGRAHSLYTSPRLG